MRTRRLSFLALGMLCWTPSAWPQATAVVRISGAVFDPSGAAVVGAQVIAINVAKGLTRPTATGTDGSYSLGNLPVGPYRLEVSAPGFKTYSQEGIILQVNTNPVVNVQLEVGQVSQEVQVTASAAMAENTGEQHLSSHRQRARPRAAAQRARCHAVGATLQGCCDRAAQRSEEQQELSNLGRDIGRRGTIQRDLLSGRRRRSRRLVRAHQSASSFSGRDQEFSVQTNAIPANYGVRAGAVVNMVTKSGTNSYHGSLFHFLRTGATNARNFFATEKDSLKRNQFRGTAGGPVLRNKLFFFDGYQGTRIRAAPPTATSFVATPAVLQGDFSTLNSAACGTPRNVIDPLTGAPFPGNQIPTSRFSP